MNKIEIPISKKKLILGIIGSILFVMIGIWLFSHPGDFQNIPFRFLRNPTTIKTIGIAAIIFFGATGIYGIKKTFDKKIGLIIDNEGVFDNSNASSIGRIRWSDITEIRTMQVMSTKFLLIYISDPDAYLENVKGMKRKLMEGNMKIYGTPVSITANTLKYNFNNLEKLLKDKFYEQQRTMPNR